MNVMITKEDNKSNHTRVAIPAENVIRYYGHKARNRIYPGNCFELFAVLQLLIDTDGSDGWQRKILRR